MKRMDKNIFPLYWTSELVSITRYDFGKLSKEKQDDIQFLEKFCVMSISKAKQDDVHFLEKLCDISIKHLMDYK